MFPPFKTFSKCTSSDESHMFLIPSVMLEAPSNLHVLRQMTFLQVFHSVCLESEAVPAAEELISHFLVLRSTAILPPLMKHLPGVLLPPETVGVFTPEHITSEGELGAS